MKMLGVRCLPDFSFADVRVLFRTVFPLKTLTKETAVEFVTKQSVGRTKSTRSRLKRTKLLIEHCQSKIGGTKIDPKME